MSPTACGVAGRSAAGPHVGLLTKFAAASFPVFRQNGGRGKVAGCTQEPLYLCLPFVSISSCVILS